MVFGKLAEHFGNVHYFSVSFHQLRLELAQKFLALLLDDRGIGNGVGRSLRDSGRQFGRNRRHALVVIAGRASLEIGGIVEVAFRAGKP